jgi:hypothetical protein
MNDYTRHNEDITNEPIKMRDLNAYMMQPYYSIVSPTFN